MRPLWVAASLALALAAIACTPEAGETTITQQPSPTPRGGVLELGVLGEPSTLDPYAPDASELTYALARPVFPTPFRVDPDGVVHPDLALSLEGTPDGARLTLDHRRWSSGRPITARDVVASIRRARPPSGFAEVDDARVVARRVVEMTGDAEDWESTLATGAFVLPRGRLAGGNVSGGPFLFSSYDRGRSLVYEANRKGPVAPLLDRIQVSFVAGTELLVRLLSDADLDAAWFPSAVNLGDRLAERGLLFASEVGAERLVARWDPGRIHRAAVLATLRLLDLDLFDESFLRDDGNVIALPRGERTELPSTISVAIPEGDELLSLIQRALRLDLERSGITAELISGPVSAFYGHWQADPPADVLLQRSLQTDLPPDSIALASLATFLAWREEVHGMAVNPSLDGPLWNAEQWWLGPSI